MSIALNPVSLLFGLGKRSGSITTSSNAIDAALGVGEGLDVATAEYDSFFSVAKGFVTGVTQGGLVGNVIEIGHDLVFGGIKTFAKNLFKSVPGFSIAFGIKDLARGVANVFQGDWLEAGLLFASAASSLVPGGRIAVEAITAGTRKMLKGTAFAGMLTKTSAATSFARNTAVREAVLKMPSLRKKLIGAGMLKAKDLDVVKYMKLIRPSMCSNPGAASKLFWDTLSKAEKTQFRDLMRLAYKREMADLAKGSLKFRKNVWKGLAKEQRIAFKSAYEAGFDKALVSYAEAPTRLGDLGIQMSANIRHSALDLWSRFRIAGIPSTLTA